MNRLNPASQPPDNWRRAPSASPRIAFVDVRTFFDKDGNFKPFREWSPEQTSQIASFEVIKKNATAGDGQVDTIHKFKFWDKMRALEMACKHFGLLRERLEHTGDVTVRWLEPGEKYPDEK